MIKTFHKYSVLKEAGNAVLSSIILAGVAAGGAAIAYRGFTDTYSSTRVGRVKAKQAIVENQVRLRAFQPEAYIDCNGVSTAACKVNPAFFADLDKLNVTGARCEDKSAGCGVITRDIRFDPASRRFSASVAYSGTELKIKPTAISLEVPLEVLQAPRFHCGERDKTKPIFVGFHPGTQEPICEGFNSCPPGQFVREVDLSRRTLVCQDLPRNISCEDQSMFTMLRWQGSQLDYKCDPLPDPPFVSNLTTRAVASLVNTVMQTETRTETNSTTSTVTHTLTHSSTQTATTTVTTPPTTNIKYEWKYDINPATCQSSQGKPGAATLPSAPYTTGIALGTGIDSYECGVHLGKFNFEGHEMMDLTCNVPNAKCDIYVNNHPPGLYSEGTICWTCSPK